MGSLISALTGGGSRAAADAQADAAYAGIEVQKKTLEEQIKLARESLDLQRDYLNQSLEMTEPYRNAGEVAMARYESLLFGVPIKDTAAYKAAASVAPKSVTSDFSDQFKSMYASTNPKYLGQKLFYDTKSRKVGLTGDVDLGVTVQKDEANLQADLQKALGVAQAPEEKDLSAFGDVNEKYGFETTPGYEFRRDEGLKGVERTAAARTGVLNGATLKATERYAQDYATNEYDNVLRRIGGVADMGLSASTNAAGSTLSSAGMQSGVLSQLAQDYGDYGANVADLNTQIGAARASGYLGTQSAYTSLFNTGLEVAGFL